MKLSVRLQTFNHSEFIEEALRGIDKQITNFNFEVVIGDDFSTDNNLSVIKSFINNSTNSRIKYRLLEREEGGDYWHRRQKNGRLENFVDILLNCTGSYIALLDGDDYWTDPYKLQKQVDFLEKKPEYSLCFHRADEWDGESIKPSKFSLNSDQERDVSKEELAKRNFIPTCSIVFRRKSLEIHDWLYQLPIGDYPLCLLLSLKGKIRYMPGNWAIYRNFGGTFTGMDQLKRTNQMIEFYDLLLSQTIFPKDMKFAFRQSYNFYLSQKLRYETRGIIDVIKHDYLRKLSIRSQLKIIFETLIDKRK